MSKKEKEISAALKFILQSEQGRMYLSELLDFCGLYRKSFTGNSETFYNEGMRNVALKLLSDIGQVDPDAYLKMMQETKMRNEIGKIIKEQKQEKEN